MKQLYIQLNEIEPLNDIEPLKEAAMLFNKMK